MHGPFGDEEWVSGWRCLCLGSLWLHLAGRSSLGANSVMGPGSPGLPAHRQSLPAGDLVRRLHCIRVWLCDQGSWGRRPQSAGGDSGESQTSALSPSSPHPQLRRSPIKKVRKSLALDIVDEDVKLVMSTLPKVLSLVRGLREKLPHHLLPLPRTAEGSSASGRMESPWRPSAFRTL